MNAVMSTLCNGCTSSRKLVYTRQRAHESAPSAGRSRGQSMGEPLDGLAVQICNENVQDKLVPIAAGVGEVVFGGRRIDVLSSVLKREDILARSSPRWTERSAAEWVMLGCESTRRCKSYVWLDEYRTRKE